MRLLAARAEFHVFDGKPDLDHPIRLTLEFDDGTRFRARGAGDGHTMLVDQQPLEPPMDLGECGYTIHRDFTDDLDASLRGERVMQSRSILNSADQLIGLALLRPNHEPFCIWIDGDEFYWGGETTLKQHDWLPGTNPTIDGPLPPRH